MRSTARLTAISAFALLISIAAFANTPETSRLPVTEPLDVGGTILQPGEYLIRVLSSPADRNKVQITSLDMKTVYATVLTVPHHVASIDEVTNTTFVYYPSGEGAPRALRTWFAPHPDASQGGHDIVYQADRAAQLARLSNERVVSYRTTEVASVETPDLVVTTPEATVETYTYPTVESTPVVQSTVAEAEAEVLAPETMASSSTVETTDNTEQSMTSQSTSDTDNAPEMPSTASELPLLALLGVISLAGAVAFRIARR